MLGEGQPRTRRIRRAAVASAAVLAVSGLAASAPKDASISSNHETIGISKTFDVKACLPDQTTSVPQTVFRCDTAIVTVDTAKSTQQELVATVNTLGFPDKQEHYLVGIPQGIPQTASTSPDCEITTTNTAGTLSVGETCVPKRTVLQSDSVSSLNDSQVCPPIEPYFTVDPKKAQSFDCPAGEVGVYKDKLGVHAALLELTPVNTATRVDLLPKTKSVIFEIPGHPGGEIVMSIDNNRGVSAVQVAG